MSSEYLLNSLFVVAVTDEAPTFLNQKLCIIVKLL